MAQVFLGLGSNLGKREANIRDAVRALEAEAHVSVVSVSPLIETDPVGGPPGQSTYINAAAELQTSLNPPALLARCQAIEAAMGRRRLQQWGPRCIDLDILLYEGSVFRSPELVIPHPRMLERAFVLEPLAAIAPNIRHPVTNKTILDHLERVTTAGDARP